nr:PREDICTED: protein TSSC1 [Bemisia tabaci]
MKEDIAIYGLEYKARTLSALTADTDSVGFLIGTQSLVMSNNQVHIVQLNEETNDMSAKIYQHDAGEIWSLISSPYDASLLVTCYNSVVTSPELHCTMGSSLWRLPNDDGTSESLLPLEKVCDFDFLSHGPEVKVTAFHPTDQTKLASVVENKILLWDLGKNSAKLTSETVMEGKGQPKFYSGKFNPQQSGSQFATLNETFVRGWDLRAQSSQVWVIQEAHSQFVRDLDFNPNRQHFLGTCGDDGKSKFWDMRNLTKPVITRSDHAHWVWSLRYNHYHDQLIATSSSDMKVILTCLSSISSESSYNQADDILDEDVENMGDLDVKNSNKPSESIKSDKNVDDVIATFEEHEDSVYCVEWSSADPWIVASLSYDGRLLINHVPKAEKYKIIL